MSPQRRSKAPARQRLRDIELGDEDLPQDNEIPTDGSWTAKGALAYGWSCFYEEWPSFVWSTLVVLLGGVLAWLGWDTLHSVWSDDAICDSSGCTGGQSWTLLNLNFAIGLALFLFVAQVLSAPLIRGAIDMTQGWRFSPLETLHRIFWLDVVLGALLSSAIVGVATVFWIVPGLVAAALVMFVPYVIVGEALNAWTGLQAALRIVREVPWYTVVWFCFGGTVLVAGFFFAGFGALMTMPLVVIGTAWTYRVLTGHEVVDPV